MKGSRLHDVFFLREEMKAMGLVSDRRFCSNLEMKNQAVKAAQEVVQNSEGFDIRKSPISIAAVVIYIVTQLFDEEALKGCCGRKAPKSACIRARNWNCNIVEWRSLFYKAAAKERKCNRVVVIWKWRGICCWLLSVPTEALNGMNNKGSGHVLGSDWKHNSVLVKLNWNKICILVLNTSSFRLSSKTILKGCHILIGSRCWVLSVHAGSRDGMDDKSCKSQCCED